MIQYYYSTHHDSLKNRNGQSRETRLDGHPLQEIKVQMGEGRVERKAKEGGASGALPIVGWNGMAGSNVRDNLCHGVSGAPQKGSSHHFGGNRVAFQVAFVPFDKTAASFFGTSTRWNWDR